MDKADRPPNPGDYLPESYVSAHRELFAKEGGSFVVIEKWITEARYPGFRARKFVELTFEMEKFIGKYKSASNDWRILNDELNLGSDLSQERIYLVKISPNDPRFQYEMPNDQEAGAYPREWVPGGAKSGTKEAALIGSEQIKHDKNIGALLDQFEDWEKLQ
ncbi:hypothetical protein [Pseudomonas syringae]|uniref:hypothetical protein n=1 Tax=Pseudomonas syringae TaxID=317 RepID=UPI0011AF69D4|nr:hypothetical protein [Pseudomonas syringae]